MKTFLLSAVAGVLLAGGVTGAPPEAPRRPRITGVAHIALAVHDMDKARGYYTDFLGFAEPYHLSNPDGSLSMTFIKINDRQYIELFPEKAAGTDRLLHFSIETDDAEAMRVYLRANGIKVPDKTTTGRIGNIAFNITDPDGHTVEITQYAPDGQTARNYGRFTGDERISARMSHVGITVGTLGPAMKFYGGILGFTEIWRGSKDGKTLNWVNMKVPDGNDYLEFMLYDRQPDPASLGTLHHLCLEVPDIAGAAARLETRRARGNYTKPMEIKTGVNRKRQLNLYDPDGTRSELMEAKTTDGAPAPSSDAAPPR